MFDPQASKTRRPSRPRRATRAKSFGFEDFRAVVIRASNCRCPQDVLQPAHVPLDIHPRRSQRVKAVLGAPAQEDPQIGLGVDASLTTVTAEEGRHRGAYNELIGQHLGKRKQER